MIHAVLLILKIIGIIILVLLGMLLLFLALVLFVPVRYRVTAEHGEGIRLEGRAGWLFHILHARVSMVNEKLLIRLRVFGFIIYDSLCPEKGIKLKGKSKSTGKKNINKDKEKDKVIHKGSADHRKDDIKSIDKSADDRETDADQNRDASDECQPKDKEENSSIISKNIEKDRKASGDAEEWEERADEEQPETIFERIIQKVKNIYHGVINFFIRMKDGMKEKYLSFIHLKQKIRLIIDFIKDEVNREGFRVTFESTVKLCKHVLPTKFRSQITFGTGDPCSTGQALGAFSILYSFYGDNIQITPDFENKVFEGKHYARGRIRLITILIIVIKLIRDKRFKQLRSNYKILKEAL